MEKWKCSNTNCNKQWSEKNPTSCPQCGLTDFKNVGGDGTIDWPKTGKIAGIILVIIFIIFIYNKCSSDEVTVKVTFKEASGVIKVDLDLNGNDQKDFNIEILRSGTIYESAKGLKTKTFSSLMSGTYYINIKYTGKKTGSDIPKINDYNKGPFIVKTIPIPLPNPTIISAIPFPDKKTKKYTINIKISPDTLTKQCEFSIDGKNFNSNNILILPPGNYTIIARLIEDNSKQHSKTIKLDSIIDSPPPKQEVIQELLNKISAGDNNSFNKLDKLLNYQINIKGAGPNISTLYELMFDCNNGIYYSIQSISITNNLITSINVRKK